MGSFIAKPFLGDVEDHIEKIKDIPFRTLAIQREAQLAVNRAWARDFFQFGSGIYSLILTGGILSRVRHGTVPVAIKAPLGLGAIILAYQYDMGYGNKMQRIVKEAEEMLEKEREIFIPPKQMPFYYIYEGEEQNNTQSVKAMWPEIVRKVLYKD
eukprot:snap_masked-scaffold_15-processed-gene-2.65-mRNA-1 protein AED:0.19 eAED:0.24 QI:0/-1/0/1/-1/1/1/0/154